MQPVLASGPSLCFLLGLLGASAHWASAQIVFDSDATIASPMEGDVHIVSRSSTPTTVDVRQPALFAGNLEVFDTSILNFHGGLVSGNLLAHETSTVNLLDGFFDDVTSDGAATLNVIGGHFDDLLSAENASAINIRGGGVDAVKASHDSRVLITGGFVDGIVTEHSASVLVSGSGFNFPYGSLEPGFGVLTGILANGDPINANFNVNGGAIVLVPVPEPSAFFVWAVCAAASLFRWRRSTAS